MATNISDVLSGFLYDTVTSLSNMDFFNKVVQFDDDPSRVATGDATFLFSGPPVLKPGGYGPKEKPVHELLKPVGAVQSYVLNEGRQIVPFSELGSKLKRYAAGQTQYSASMARVLTKSGNLDYALYSWLNDWLVNVMGDTSGALNLAIPPGANNDQQWVSKESDIYLIPFGLLAITGTAGGQIIHMEYLERCFIQGGGNSKAAGNPLVVDNVSILVTRPVPFVNDLGETLFSLPGNKYELRTSQTVEYSLKPLV